MTCGKRLMEHGPRAIAPVNLNLSQLVKLTQTEVCDWRIERHESTTGLYFP